MQPRPRRPIKITRPSGLDLAPPSNRSMIVQMKVLPVLLSLPLLALAHEGPAPLVNDRFQKQFLRNDLLVAFFPVLGNHEQNAAHYYNYVSVPAPEYYYTFTHGNARFFMVDTNKKCDPDSEQYKWLAQQLAESKEHWKILCHHQPAYTTDEDDYGKLWQTNKSTRGDLNARHLAHLAHQHHVDLIWNGHIHSYERTWPLDHDKPVDQGGTIHLITGGGGGHLETPGPFRAPFTHIVQRGHHYTMVWVNGSHLVYKAYDLEGRLFDSFELRKAAQEPSN